MQRIARRVTSRVARVAAVAMVSACSSGVVGQSLTITEQGGRPFGGRVVGESTTGSLHCDHGYVEWQIPANPRRTPSANPATR